jgi:putative FmdB family regulatory protein
MPGYDYVCNQCHKRVVIYQSYEEYGRKEVQCPHCGSKQLTRRIGRVRIARSDDDHFESMADPSRWGDVDQDDPRSLARFMRKMGSELGEEMPPEFDEVVDRLDSGESPEEIEKNMPDLDGVDGTDLT